MELNQLLAINRKLPHLAMENLKERKSKIRKFMLYINTILNETEHEIHQIASNYQQLEDALKDAGVICNKEKFFKTAHNMSSSKSLEAPEIADERYEDILVAETAPRCDGIISTDFEKSITIQETNIDITRLGSPDGGSTQDNDTFFLPSAADSQAIKPKDSEATVWDSKVNMDSAHSEEFKKPLDRHKRHKIHHTKVKCTKPNTMSEVKLSGYEAKNSHDSSQKNDAPDEQEKAESMMLSPVSSLVNSVLGRRRVDASNNQQQQTQSQSRVTESTKPASLSSSRKPAIDTQSSDRPGSPQDKPVRSLPSHLIPETSRAPVDLTKSPALFDDEEEDDYEDEPVSDDDITQLPQSKNLDVSDIVVTKEAKKPVKWPIGYPKPVPRGELVVEPSSGRQSNKRVRQTRLDGFLAKASVRNSSQPKQSIISMNCSASTSGQQAADKTQHNVSKKKKRVETPEASKILQESVHSDSDDALDDLDLELLNTDAGVTDGSGNRTSIQSRTAAASDTPHSATSSSRLTRREHDTTDSFPRKKPKLQIGEVVRGRARKELTGYRCMQCYEYYKTLGLSEDEIQERLDEVCRHRAVKPPMQTPPSFWNMSIMSNPDASGSMS